MFCGSRSRLIRAVKQNVKSCDQDVLHDIGCDVGGGAWDNI